MSEANEAVLETLEYALIDINYNVPGELYDFWIGWLRSGYDEAVNKGYDY